MATRRQATTATAQIHYERTHRKAKNKKQLKIDIYYIRVFGLLCLWGWWGQTYDITYAPLHVNINKRQYFRARCLSIFCKNTYKYFWTLRFIDWLKVKIPNVQNRILIVEILYNKKTYKQHQDTTRVVLSTINHVQTRLLHDSQRLRPQTRCQLVRFPKSDLTMSLL